MKINEKKFIGKAFVGIDVHKSNWKVCVLGELNFKKEFSCDPYPKALETSLAMSQVPYSCRHNSSTTWWFLD